MLIITVPTSFVIAETRSDLMPYPADLYAQCFDGKDNDGDGKIDLKDKDCPICHDGLDNDADGLIDEKDPDCPKKSPLRSAAAAVLGWDSDEGIFHYGGEIPSGGTIGGGYIATGGALGSCTRVVNFPRRVRTDNGGYYYINDYYCDTNIAGGGDLDTYLDENSRMVRVRTGGTVPSGGFIGGGNIPVSNQISSGGTIKTSTITSGGTIATGTTIPTATTITVSENIPYGGSISTAGTIKTGGTIPTTSFSAGGSVAVGGTIPTGTVSTGGSSNAGGIIPSGGIISAGGSINTGGAI